MSGDSELRRSMAVAGFTRTCGHGDHGGRIVTSQPPERGQLAARLRDMAADIAAAVSARAATRLRGQLVLAVPRRRG